MQDIRENIVNLWAKVVNQEIAQTNFWFFKKSSWKDMDIIGIKPGRDIISLYNVKSNLNTDSKKSKTYSPEKIAENYIDSIYALNKAYNNNFRYNLYLIFESADRLGSRIGKITIEWLDEIKENKEKYKNEIMNVLINNGVKLIEKLVVKSLYKCVFEIKNKIKSSPAGLGTHCFEFENGIFVYPFHKISMLKFLDIYTDYNL